MSRLVIALAYLSGCNWLLGSGTILIWNHGEAAVTVELDGPTEARVEVPAGHGYKLESATVGTYQLRVNGRSSSFELADEQVAVRSVGSAGCFVRTDISGMYLPGRERVRVLETYRELEGFTMPVLHVFPDEPVPSAKPRSDYAFQRLMVVPCDIVGDHGAVMEFLRKRE